MIADLIDFRIAAPEDVFDVYLWSYPLDTRLQRFDRQFILLAEDVLVKSIWSGQGD